jgi:hypothetical protein
MPVIRLHGLCDLLVAVVKEKRLGWGTIEQDAVDGRKVGGPRHQLANGLCLLDEDDGGHLRAQVRGILDLGLPGCHILADILSPRLELFNVLLGSAVQGRERSLAGGIDLVSEGTGGFRASQGGETARAGCISLKLHILKGLAFHELGAQVGDPLQEIKKLELQGGFLVLEHADTCLDLPLAQTGGPLCLASRRLSAEARLAFVITGCVRVADVAQGAEDLPILRSPIGSA